MRKNPEHVKLNAFESIILCCCFFFMFFIRFSVIQSDFFLLVIRCELFIFFQFLRAATFLKSTKTFSKTLGLIHLYLFIETSKSNKLFSKWSDEILFFCYFSWRIDDFRFRILLFWPLSVGWCCYFQCVIRSIVYLNSWNLAVWELLYDWHLNNWKLLCCQWHGQEWTTIRP